MTHAHTKSELLNIATHMDEDEVMLCDMWDRECFCEAHEVKLTPVLWRQFIDEYSRHCGLEELRDAIDEFVAALPDGDPLRPA